MDELDREMILADRAEARDAAMERKRAEQALRQQQEQQQRAAEKVANIYCALLRKVYCYLHVLQLCRPLTTGMTLKEPRKARQ